MQEAALIGAGVVGSLTALVHGYLVDKLMTRPLRASAGALSARVAGLLSPLLQFSTFNWLVTGAALIGAALWLGPEGRLVVGCLAATSYGFGAVCNFMASRGRHPGWVLMTLALLLIAAGLAA